MEILEIKNKIATLEKGLANSFFPPHLVKATNEKLEILRKDLHAEEEAALLKSLRDAERTTMLEQNEIALEAALLELSDEDFNSHVEKTLAERIASAAAEEQKGAEEILEKEKEKVIEEVKVEAQKEEKESHEAIQDRIEALKNKLNGFPMLIKMLTAKLAEAKKTKSPEAENIEKRIGELKNKLNGFPMLIKMLEGKKEKMAKGGAVSVKGFIVIYNQDMRLRERWYLDSQKEAAEKFSAEVSGSVVPSAFKESQFAVKEDWESFKKEGFVDRWNLSKLKLASGGEVKNKFKEGNRVIDSAAPQFGVGKITSHKTDWGREEIKIQWANPMQPVQIVISELHPRTWDRLKVVEELEHKETPRLDSVQFAEGGELSPQLQSLINDLAEDFKSEVSKIEKRPATTKNHYGDYMAFIDTIGKGMNGAQKKIVALALIKAGASSQGVADAMKISTGRFSKGGDIESKESILAQMNELAKNKYGKDSTTVNHKKASKEIPEYAALYEKYKTADETRYEIRDYNDSLVANVYGDAALVKWANELRDRDKVVTVPVATNVKEAEAFIERQYDGGQGQLFEIYTHGKGGGASEGGIKIASGAKLNAEKIANFKEYVNSFYGEDSIYGNKADWATPAFTKEEIDTAVKEYLESPSKHFPEFDAEWGGGDSTDRERVSQIILNKRGTYKDGGGIEKQAELVDFDSMYDGKVKAYESVSQKDLYFYVSKDDSTGAYIVTSEAEGFPATEAFDDWMQSYEVAMSIAKDLAEDKDVYEGGSEPYAEGGEITTPQGLGSALKKYFKEKHGIDIKTRYIKTVRGLDRSYYEISTFRSNQIIPNEVRKELVELSYGKPLSELGVHNPEDISYGNMRNQSCTVFGGMWKQWLASKGEKFAGGGEVDIAWVKADLDNLIHGQTVLYKGHLLYFHIEKNGDKNLYTIDRRTSMPEKLNNVDWEEVKVQKKGVTYVDHTKNNHGAWRALGNNEFSYGGDVSTPVKLNGYSVNIYKSDYESQANVVSNKHKRMVLVTDGVNGDSRTVMSNEPYLKLETTNIRGEYLYAIPVNFGVDKEWKMFGGNFIWSSDSRFREDVSERPIPLHDRIEGRKFESGGGIKSDNLQSLLSYLEKHQSKEAIDIKKVYSDIREKEGMYGTRPQIHVFSFNIIWDGEEYSGRGEHIYGGYPNFTNKYGELPSVTEMDVSEKGGGHIARFYFTEDKWTEVYEKITGKKFESGGSVEDEMYFTVGDGSPVSLTGLIAANSAEGVEPLGENIISAIKNLAIGEKYGEGANMEVITRVEAPDEIIDEASGLTDSERAVAEQQYKVSQNDYAGLSPAQVWDGWTSVQRDHFLTDHSKEISPSLDRSTIEEAVKLDYKDVMSRADMRYDNFEGVLKTHVARGQYAKGGEVKDILKTLNEAINKAQPKDYDELATIVNNHTKPNWGWHAEKVYYFGAYQGVRIFINTKGDYFHALPSETEIYSIPESGLPDLVKSYTDSTGKSQRYAKGGEVTPADIEKEIAKYKATFDDYCKKNERNPEIQAKASELLDEIIANTKTDKGMAQLAHDWFTGKGSTLLLRDELLAKTSFSKKHPSNSPEDLLNFNAFALLDTVSLYNKQGGYKDGGKVDGQWFQESIHRTLGGWNKTEAPEKRRDLAIKSRPKNWKKHTKTLSAARALLALSNVSEDKETKEEAKKDAEYFFKKAVASHRQMKFGGGVSRAKATLTDLSHLFIPEETNYPNEKQVLVIWNEKQPNSEEQAFEIAKTVSPELTKTQSDYLFVDWMLSSGTYETGGRVDDAAVKEAANKYGFVWSDKIYRYSQRFEKGDEYKFVNINFSPQRKMWRAGRVFSFTTPMGKNSTGDEQFYEDMNKCFSESLEWLESNGYNRKELKTFEYGGSISELNKGDLVFCPNEGSNGLVGLVTSEKKIEDEIEGYDVYFRGLSGSTLFVSTSDMHDVIDGYMDVAENKSDLSAYKSIAKKLGIEMSPDKYEITEEEEFKNGGKVGKKGGIKMKAINIEHPAGSPFWHVRFKKSDTFKEGSIRVPEWASNVANSISKGAKAYTGQTEKDGKWATQKVLVSSSLSEAEAKKTAEEIACKLDYACKKQNEKSK